jgi:hypothetical protein
VAITFDSGRLISREAKVDVVSSNQEAERDP